MAFSIHDRSERRSRLYSYIYSVRAGARHTLHDERIHHRPPRSSQYGTRLRRDGHCKGMAVGGLHERAHRIYHHELLCSSVGMVPAIHLRLGIRRAQRQSAVHHPILSGILLFAHTSRILDGGNTRTDPLRYNTRCAQRHRACIKDDDADAVCAARSGCNRLVHAARSR